LHCCFVSYLGAGVTIVLLLLYPFLLQPLLLSSPWLPCYFLCGVYVVFVISTIVHVPLYPDDDVILHLIILWFFLFVYTIITTVVALVSSLVLFVVELVACIVADVTLHLCDDISIHFIIFVILAVAFVSGTITDVYTSLHIVCTAPLFILFS
jgi:hypothetical protein